MPVLTPPIFPYIHESNLNADGTVDQITASATTHTKGAYAVLVASTLFDTYGLTVCVRQIGGNASTVNEFFDRYFCRCGY